MVGAHADSRCATCRGTEVYPRPTRGINWLVYRISEVPHGGDAATRDGVLEAVRFAALVAVAAAGFLALAEMWIGTCGASTFDALACGAPQRTFLAVGAPLILLVGGLRAFHRTYQLRRDQGIAWPWQGAAWFLLAAMLLVLTKSMPLTALP